MNIGVSQCLCSRIPMSMLAYRNVYVGVSQCQCWRSAMPVFSICIRVYTSLLVAFFAHCSLSIFLTLVLYVYVSVCGLFLCFFLRMAVCASVTLSLLACVFSISV